MQEREELKAFKREKKMSREGNNEKNMCMEKKERQILKNERE
jgi:hypothetical protein